MTLRVPNLQLLIKNTIFIDIRRKICLNRILNQETVKQVVFENNSQLPINKDRTKSEKLSRAMISFLQRKEDYGRLV